MTRARMVRRAVGCALAAVIVGVAAWFFGMDGPHVRLREHPGLAELQEAAEVASLDHHLSSAS